MLKQQPKNSSTNSSTALIRKENVNSPPAILNTLSEPGLRKWEYPPIASGTTKNRRSQAPSLGKCAHNEIKAIRGIIFARPAKKRDLIRSERRIPPCEQFEMPKDDHGMRQYNQSRLPVQFPHRATSLHRDAYESFDDAVVAKSFRR